MFKQLKGSCPICSGARKDCRSGDAGMIHCRSNLTPIGYEVHGEDASGFTIYKLSQTAQESDSKLLGIITRNAEYRKSVGSLRSHHRKALLDRGLTSSQIDQLVKTEAIRSWEPGTQTTLDRGLAGIDPATGKTLGVKGIAIAALLNNNITGYQIANDDRSSAKYIWLSSANQGGNGPHLPSGDLPIACWVHPTEAPAEAILCEGFLKSLIVAQKLWALGQNQYLVLGAAGGNFSASSNTTQQILNEHGITSVLLAPDAGALSNPQVMSAYDRTRTSVCVGRQVNVLWWGQETKDHKDIDELADRDLKNLALIEWDEFKAMVPQTQQTKDKGDRKLPNVEILAQITDRCELWQTDDRIPMIDIQIAGHIESIAVADPRFRSWLASEFRVKTDRYCSSDALSQLLECLRGQALSAPTHQVYHRVALHEGEVYIDLGDLAHTIVKVCGVGWTILEGKCPVKFRRPSSMKALPMPNQETDWSGLRNILNLQEPDWVLLMSWLSWGLYPDRPHPLLILNGEQGTGKSKTTELLKRLLDPSKALLLSLPRETRDLKAHANNRWLLAYDNISGLSTEMSDNFCKLATKVGLSDRSLYTDADEFVFDGVRPLVLNGIEALATRPDLLERSIILNLQPITDEQRMTEAEWEQILSDSQAAIFGSLLNALAQGLRLQGKKKLASLARMADFHVWGHCVETAFGFEPGTFEASYQHNRKLVHETAIDNNAIATAILQLLETQNFTGTASDLLKKLGEIVTEEQRKAPDWIKSPRVLGRQLVRLAPELRKHGIEIRTGLRIAGARIITLELIPKAPEIIPDPPQEEPEVTFEYEYVAEELPLAVGEQVKFADSETSNVFLLVKIEPNGACTLELKQRNGSTQQYVSQLGWLTRANPIDDRSAG
jgi:hypothetical protein